MNMKESREFLEKIGMPGGDAFNLPTSKKRFPDDCQYRFEIFGVQHPAEFSALLKEIENEDLFVHRITQTDGIMNLTDEELREMIAMAGKHNVQLLLAVGPRATTDLSPAIHTRKGVTMGNRLRGQEQVVRAMEDVKRAARFGGRYFLVYDEGSLWVFDKMRELGEIPADCHFKFSAHSGYGNPCSIKLLENLGANSVNPVWDMELTMLAAIRQAVDIPLDVHMVTPKPVGGFIRYYEAPEMVKVAAPIYLKLGATDDPTDSLEAKARKKVKQLILVKEKMDAYYPEAKLSPKGSID